LINVIERKHISWEVRNEPLCITEVNFVLKVLKIYWNTNFLCDIFSEKLDSIFLSEVKNLP